MTWAELFERADECAVTEDHVRERLVQLRERRGETDEGVKEGNGE